MAKMKSKKQVGYLLSKGSPLTGPQKDKLKSELHSGEVKVKKLSPKVAIKRKEHGYEK
jgi:hypothetical protein